MKNNLNMLIETLKKTLTEENRWKYTFHDEEGNFDVSFKSHRYVYILTFNPADFEPYKEEYICYILRKPIFRNRKTKLSKETTIIPIIWEDGKNNVIHYINYPPNLTPILKALQESITEEFDSIEKEEKQEKN